MLLTCHKPLDNHDDPTFWDRRRLIDFKPLQRSKVMRLFTNNWMLGIMFGLGLNIAGADGEWIPWANFIGVLMVGYVVLIANYLRPAP